MNAARAGRTRYHNFTMKARIFLFLLIATHPLGFDIADRIFYVSEP